MFSIFKVSKSFPTMLGILIIASFASCDRTREDKGREYFPDMAYSPAYQTYSENPAMEDGRTMLKPVSGTVPRHMIPYPYEAGFEGRDLASQLLFNPLRINQTTIDEGEVHYNVFCSNCHGAEGDGAGNLFTTGRYIIPPTSLITPQATDFSQGEKYHVITTGWGVMGPHGSLIQPEDRWKIIAFIEEVLQGR